MVAVGVSMDVAFEVSIDVAVDVSIDVAFDISISLSPFHFGLPCVLEFVAKLRTRRFPRHCGSRWYDT
jgi:hypothetical protein